MGFSDISAVTETHESPMRPLPGYPSYQWLSVCKDEVKTSSGVHGFGRVACLVRDDIFNFTSVVHFDTFARFM